MTIHETGNFIMIGENAVNFHPGVNDSTIEVDQGGGITNWDTEPPTSGTPDDAAHSDNTVYTPDPQVGHDGSNP